MFIKNKIMARQRAMMRGYQISKKNDNLGLITRLKDELTNFSFRSITESSSILFFGSANAIGDTIIKQYLLSRIGSYNLNSELLRNLGTHNSSFSYPFPKEWLRVIEKYGFKINYTKSFLLWNTFLFKSIFFGGFRLFNEIRLSIIEILSTKRESQGSYVYFDTLVSGNIPKNNSNSKSYDIISWFLEWEGRNHEILEICHSVKDVDKNFKKSSQLIRYLPRVILPINRPFQLINYTLWGVKVTTLALIELIRGNWWNCLIFPETIYAGLVKRQSIGSLANEYYFHNSSWLYRPLWTYEAEKFGSKVIFYFYSTNAESFKLKEGYEIQANSWQLLTWNNFLVWDKYQKEFIERYAKKINEVLVVGPIWFSDNIDEDIPFDPNSVAVFDVQPQRDFLYQKLAIESEYYIPSVANQFLLDISKVLSEIEVKFIFKRKRNIGNKVHIEYKSFIDKLSKEGLLLEINPEISAYKIIKNCKAVISMPFTSTAIIAKELGKKSIYYDPSGIIQKDDRAAHGIPVVTGIEELKNWFETLNS
jgi:polysaccharide biosynthesis PFTS motif protein